MEKEFDEEIQKIESSLERVLGKKFPWVAQLKIDRKHFIENKKSEHKYKYYIVNVFITKNDFQKLRTENSKNEVETFEEQLSLLFDVLVKDKSKSTVTMVPNIIK